MRRREREEGNGGAGGVVINKAGGGGRGYDKMTIPAFKMQMPYMLEGICTYPHEICFTSTQVVR